MRDADTFYKRLVSLMEDHLVSTTDIVGIGYNLILTLPKSDRYPQRLQALMAACETMQLGIHEDSAQIERASDDEMLAAETRMAAYDT